MLHARAFFAASFVLCAASAHAQNAKDTCADASERGQKLVDDRRLLEARNAFLTCAQESCPAAVRRDCQAQLDDVKKNVPSVVVRVKDQDGSDVARGAVSIDGVKIGVLDGQTIDTDPGTHKIRVELPDGHAFDRQVILTAGERGRAVTFDANGRDPSVSPTAAPSIVVVDTHAKTQWSTLRTVGFVTILAGGAGVVLGVVTQLLAFVFQGDATTLSRGTSCNPSDPNDPLLGDSSCSSAHGYHNQALTMQDVALGSLATGGVLLVTGLVLFFVGGNVEASPKASVHMLPLFGPNMAGLGAVGTF